jgi:hypothetical protein
MASLTQFRDKFEEILALNESLTKLETLRKKRDLLKIVLIGFFLYRELETQKKSLYDRKKTCVQELRNETDNYFQNLKIEINKEILSDSLFPKYKESQLLAYLDEFNKAISYLMKELVFLSEYAQIKNFVKDNLSAYLKETNLIRNRIVSHNGSKQKII